MERSPPGPVTEDEIHAMVDGQLSSDALAALQERLALDPQAQATLQRWERQRNALRGLHQEVLAEALPTTLVTAAQQTADSQQQMDQWWRWGGRAAGLMLAFGIGWIANTTWQAAWPDRATIATLVNSGIAPEFAREASIAHAVFSPEVRHPVEVAAADQAHLVQWLSKRLGKQLKIPSLTPQGYELVGGRLLAGDLGARAQFMFQNSTGVRLTLYLGAVDKAAGSTVAGETAFRFTQEGAVSSFYWFDQGFGYALAGQIARQDLMKLAEAVYRQL
jgi:anti-sigma factor RsiW